MTATLVHTVPTVADDCDPREMQKLYASDGASGNQFGFSVGISGDVVILGAPYDDENGDNAGAVYVFRLIGGVWTQEQKLLAADGANGDTFGVSVAIDGNVIVVGAERGDDLGGNSGSAYVFRYSGSQWVEEQKLLASDGEGGDYFGRAVALSGSVALIGAVGDDDVARDAGAVYVFTFDGLSWQEQQKLLAADGASDDFFGTRVALAGSLAIVGVPSKDLDNAGAAYLYRRDGAGTWMDERKLTAPVPSPEDQFGSAVAVNSDTAVVGAYLDDDDGANAGSVYVFRHQGGDWHMLQRLSATPSEPGRQFGWSVGLTDTTMIVGAVGADDLGTNAGAAHVFRSIEGVWEAGPPILASDGGTGDLFAYGVAVAGDIAVFGAPFVDDQGSNAGAGFVFDVNCATPANLTDFNVRKGTLVTGNRAKLRVSDNRRVRIDAEFTGAAPAYLTVTDFDFRTEIASPDRLDLVIESRLTKNGGTAKVYMRRWSNNKWASVGTYTIGKSEHVVTIPNLRAARYVNEQGEIKVRIRHEMLATPFQSQFDFLQILVRE